MKLPNPNQAIIDSQKLSGYCLNPTHPDGQHKARVFRSTLGLTQADEQELCNALKAALIEYDAILEGENNYGKKYVIDFLMIKGDRQAVIHSVWIVRFTEEFPRLVSCYVL